MLGAQCAMWVVLVDSGVCVDLLQPTHWVNKSRPIGLTTQMMKSLKALQKNVPKEFQN